MNSSSSSSSQRPVFDRFIPVRSGMDLDVSSYLLKNMGPATKSTAGSPYQRRLAEVVLKNCSRILAFNNCSKPPQSPDPAPKTPIKKLPTRCVSQSQEKPLCFHGIPCDELLNLLDWGKENVLAVGIENVVYLWNASTRSEQVIADDDVGSVTSVSWSPDGRQLAVGLHTSQVQLWDVESARLLRTLPRLHRYSLVGSLAWRSSSDNNNILASGATDTNIEISDMRSNPSRVGTFRGHDLEVCRLKWSDSGLRLASGGLDGLVHVWDVSMGSSSNRPPYLRQNRWLHRFDHHNDAVTGLAWCPFKSDVLASGAGAEDMRITFWDAQTGTHLNSLDVGSRVSSLCWNVHEPELLSSHGFPNNQLALWRYPVMEKTAELMAHTAPIQWTAMSPDGCTVASVSATEGILFFWDLYRSDPQVLHKQSARSVGSGSGLFSSTSYIR